MTDRAVSTAGNAALMAQLARIDALRAELLSTIEALTPAQRRHKPGVQEWSVLEVLEHLVLAEHVVLGPRDSWRSRAIEPRSLADRLRYFAVLLVLKRGIRVQVASEHMRPSGTPTFSQLKRAWDLTHDALRTFVLELDPRGLRRAIFRHPVAGALTVRDTLRLLEAHLETHREQMRRIVHTTH